MRRQLEVWHMLVGLAVTLLTAIVFAWNIAVAKGRSSERLEMTQFQHGERITKLETNREIDLKEQNEKYDIIMNSIFEIKILLKDKQDRQ